MSLRLIFFLLPFSLLIHVGIHHLQLKRIWQWNFSHSRWHVQCIQDAAEEKFLCCKTKVHNKMRTSYNYLRVSYNLARLWEVICAFSRFYQIMQDMIQPCNPIFAASSVLVYLSIRTGHCSRVITGNTLQSHV